VADNLLDLGEVIQLYFGENDNAKAMYDEALSIANNYEGHPIIGKTMRQLGMWYSYQRNNKKAIIVLTEATTLLTKSLGPDHPLVAACLNGWGCSKMYQNGSRFSVEAEKLLLKSLEIRERVYGEKHPTIARTLTNLAVLYRSSERKAESEALFLRALQMRKDLFGNIHSEVAGSLNSLAQLYNVTNQIEKAEAMWIDALAIEEQTLGKDHKNCSHTLNNLAALYIKTRRYQLADEAFVRIIAIREKDTSRLDDLVRAFTGYLSLLNNSNYSLPDRKLRVAEITERSEAVKRQQKLTGRISQDEYSMPDQ